MGGGKNLCSEGSRWYFSGGHINSYVQQTRGTTVYIPGGNRLAFSRKINLIGPTLARDLDGALRARFQDLAQDNFHFGLVHLSYYLTEPVVDPSWEIRLLIPVVEDDITPVVLFKAVLSTYEGLGAIYVPPFLNKQTLLSETGLDIVTAMDTNWVLPARRWRTLISSVAGWWRKTLLMLLK